MLFVLLKFLMVVMVGKEAFYEMIGKRYLARSRNLSNLSNLSILNNLSSLAKSYQHGFQRRNRVQSKGESLWIGKKCGNSVFPSKWSSGTI